MDQFIFILIFIGIMSSAVMVSAVITNATGIPDVIMLAIAGMAGLVVAYCVIKTLNDRWHAERHLRR